MNVLLAFPMSDNQTGLFVKRAFEQNGCSVMVCDLSRGVDVYDTFVCGEYDLVFCSRTSELLDDIHRVKMVSGVPVVCWNVDKRDDVREFGEGLLRLFNECDILFTIALGNVDQYRELLPGTRIEHLQQGCDPEVHKIEELSNDEWERYGCDVMFAGGCFPCHKGRRELLDYIGEELPRRGYTFKGYGPAFGKAPIYDSEHNKAVRGAKVVLGHNGWPDIAVSMSVRDYKVLAACKDTFFVTEHCEGYYDFLGTDRGVFLYKTKEECLDLLIQKVEDSHFASLEPVSKHIRENHTYKKRIDKVLEVCKEIINF